MDVITLVLAKQYTDSQRICGIEPGLTLVTENSILEIYQPDPSSPLAYAKISNDSVDFEKISRITMKEEGMEIEFPLEQLTVMPNAILLGNVLLAKSDDYELDGFGPGTWVMYADADNCVSRMEFPETIHPIDPKFIPAMDSITLNGADGKQYRLAVDESGNLAATAME